jgi:uncharacterized phage-associated protein
MHSAHDVAAYILDKSGPMTAMKLQKLVYYSQAWHLVWEGTELFPENIEAWANGPVVRELYDVHRGMLNVGTWPAGNAAALDDAERSSIDAVLNFYGDKTAFWLSELTHAEDPWKEAREGLAPGVRSNREITPASMQEYYSSLV